MHCYGFTAFGTLLEYDVKLAKIIEINLKVLKCIN